MAVGWGQRRDHSSSVIRAENGQETDPGKVPASPIIGILLLIAWLATTYAFGRAALGLPLFGNRL